MNENNEDLEGLRVVSCCPLSVSDNLFFDLFNGPVFVGEINIMPERKKYRGNPLVVYQKTDLEVDKNIQLEINRMFDRIFDEVFERRMALKKINK